MHRIANTNIVVQGKRRLVLSFSRMDVKQVGEKHANHHRIVRLLDHIQKRVDGGKERLLLNDTQRSKKQ